MTKFEFMFRGWTEDHCRIIKLPKDEVCVKLIEGEVSWRFSLSDSKGSVLGFGNDYESPMHSACETPQEAKLQAWDKIKSLYLTETKEENAKD